MFYMLSNKNDFNIFKVFNCMNYLLILEYFYCKIQGGPGLFPGGGASSSEGGVHYPVNMK